MGLHSYGKIYNLGHRAIENLFDGNVLIEEKIDGSQFSFGLDFEGILHCRSRRIPIIQDNPGMFNLAITTAQRLAGEKKLQPGWTYRCEYLNKPKHNTLMYDRVPSHNLIVFDVDKGDQHYVPYHEKANIAFMLGLEVVARLHWGGGISSIDELLHFLKEKSALGGALIEGMVIKNYQKFGEDGKVLMGKHVSEQFKESHQKNWKEQNPGSEIRIQIGDALCTEARWEKAIQRLRDEGTLLNEPQDIGPLMKEISMDVLNECKPDIQDQLFKWAWGIVSRRVTRGFPDYYKNRLAASQFEGKDNASNQS